MSVTLPLSSQPLVAAYLAAKSFDFAAIKEKLVAETSLLSVLTNELNTAKAEYDRESKRLDATKADLEAKMEAADKSFRKNFCKFDHFCGVWTGHYEGTTPGRSDFNPAKLAAREAADAAKEAFKRCDSFPWTESDLKDAAESKLKEVGSRISSLRTAHAAASAKIDSTRSALPTGASDLPDDQLRTFVDYRVPAESDYWWPEVSQSVALAMIRGEVDIKCNRCANGHEIVAFTDTLTVVLDDEVRHPVCAARAAWDDDDLAGLIPVAYHHHRVHGLQPWPKSPIATDRQTKVIGKLPSYPEDVRGWLLVGPAGSSKTTYAAASITDMLTVRLANGVRRDKLNFFQIKVPNWVREMEAWDTRDFGDDRIDPPNLTPASISEETRRTGNTPILWLEELDKLKPTPSRINYLFRLIDAVYEVGGTIIATTNDTLPELRKRLSDPVYRRLSGVNDDPAKFWVLDLHETTKLKVKG